MWRDGNISQSTYQSLTGCNTSGSACPPNPKNFPKVHFHFASSWTGPTGYVMSMVDAGA